MITTTIYVKGGGQVLSLDLDFNSQNEFIEFKKYIYEKYGDNHNYDTYEEAYEYTENIWSEYENFDYIEN